MLQKWYIHTLLLLLQPHFPLGDCVFGARKGRQTADMVIFAQVLWEKGLAFSIPIVAVKLDLRKCFASVNWSFIWKALLRDCPPHLLAVAGALMREVTSVSASAVLGPASTRPWKWKRGLREGSPESNWLLNLVVWFVLEPLLARWRECGYGVALGSCFFFAVVWVDDPVIFAPSVTIAQTMLDQAVVAFGQFGGKVATKKLSWTANCHTHVRLTAKFRLGPPLHAFSDKINLLGVDIGDGSFASNPELRCARAWQAFWAKSHVLCDGDLQVAQRFRLLWKEVLPSALYLSESWTNTVTAQRLLDRTVLAMARRVLRPRREDGELWIPYLRRATRITRAYIQTLSLELPSVLLLRRRWRFCKRVALRYEATALLRQALSFTSRADWEGMPRWHQPHRHHR